MACQYLTVHDVRMQTNGRDAHRFSRSCHCVSIHDSAGDCTMFHGVGVIMEDLFFSITH